MAFTTIGTVARKIRSFLASHSEAGASAFLVELPDNSLSIAQADANGYQKVSVESSGLPTGAATSAKQDTIIAALANLATSALQTTLNGYVAPGTWTPATAATSADSNVISAAPTTVRTLVVTNGSANARYFMIFDSATVPADTTAPRIPAILVPATTSVEIRVGGLVCANGLSWSMSSTQSTKTITSDTAHVCSAELV